MAEQKPGHTPGPWMCRRPGAGPATATGELENWPFHIDRHGTLGWTNWGVLVAKCWGHTTESTEANARLIAAAPDLYYACWLISALCQEDGEPCDGFRFREAVEMARAAVADVGGYPPPSDWQTKAAREAGRAALAEARQRYEQRHL